LDKKGKVMFIKKQREGVQMIKPLYALILLGLAVTGCSQMAPQASRDPSNDYLVGLWSLHQVDEQYGQIEAPYFTLREDDKKRLQISGFNGCNTFFGFVKIERSHLVTIGPLATTRRLCQTGANALEREFMSSIEAGLQYSMGRLQTQTSGILIHHPINDASITAPIDWSDSTVKR
jgi:heat shock protein HslJ